VFSDEEKKELLCLKAVAYAYVLVFKILKAGFRILSSRSSAVILVNDFRHPAKKGFAKKVLPMVGKKRADAVETLVQVFF